MLLDIKVLKKNHTKIKHLTLKVSKVKVLKLYSCFVAVGVSLTDQIKTLWAVQYSNTNSNTVTEMATTLNCLCRVAEELVLDGLASSTLLLF